MRRPGVTKTLDGLQWRAERSFAKFLDPIDLLDHAEEGRPR